MMTEKSLLIPLPPFLFRRLAAERKQSYCSLVVSASFSWEHTLFPVYFGQRRFLFLCTDAYETHALGVARAVP